MKANPKAKKLISEMPKDVQAFVSEIDEDLRAKGITFYVSSGKSVRLGCGKCGGYFDPANKVLAVAANNSVERFLMLLCHESRHVLQNFNKKSIWHDPVISENHSLFFSWLSGEKHKNPETLAAAAIAIEKECEKMTLKLIKRRFSHIVNPKKYERMASIYLYGHLWMLETGKWFTKELYQRDILEACEPVLRREYTSIPPKLRKAFERCL